MIFFDDLSVLRGNKTVDDKSKETCEKHVIVKKCYKCRGKKRS